MANGKRIVFDPFCLDLANECLWKGSQALKLRPKAFAVIEYLARHSGQLVTKEELLNAVWPDTFVGEAVLKVVIRQIREVLGDDPALPRFIETAHRRGYRFIGQIVERDQSPEMKDDAIALTPVPGSRLRHSDFPQTIVGRDDALSRMLRWTERILRGERQTVFVTGEAGIGKTAVVDAFANSMRSQVVRIARAQCLEQYGTSEAYLPVLDAIGDLSREQPEVMDVLRARAPLWLLQLPSLVNPSERERLSRELYGATRERMMREMAETLEVLAAEIPLLLILEDLHWSDYSTLDLISYVSRQRQPAKLMLLGTYRTVELIVTGHPLQAVKRELLAKQQCEELPLDYLTEKAIARYLSLKFPANQFPPELAGLIHKRTEGNPLFMVNVVDYLVGAGLIAEDKEGWELSVAIDHVEVGVPESVKHMIEKHIDKLEPNARRTLEVASVAGAEFSTLALVAGLQEDRLTIETQCEELAGQGQFIRDCGAQALENGEAVSRYAFIHALYQNVLYEGLFPSRRVQLHRRIGEYIQNLHGDRSREVAAELAMHFERGSDYKHAAKYFQQAADNETRRFAYTEAVLLSRRGLQLVAKLPDTPERAQLELSLQITLGVPLIATEGYAAPEVGAVYLRARDLCRQLGETKEISQVLWGLWTFYTLRGQLAIALETAEEFLHLAERLPYPGLAMRGHWAMEIDFLHLGEFTKAIGHFEKALGLYDPERHLEDAFLYAQNPGVAMRCFAAWALWFVGQPDQALARMQEALSFARKLSEPHGLAHALFFSAVLHQLRREAQSAQEDADAAIAVSNEHGLVLYQAFAIVVRGWALFEQGQHVEAIEHMSRGLAAYEATGTELMRPYILALLAHAMEPTQPEAALGLVHEALALAQRNGERYFEAELYRLKGELLLRQSVSRAASEAPMERTSVTESGVANAETCFAESMKISRRQNAKLFELRAGMSLARLYYSRGKPEDARALLAPLYGQVTEGFDTIDMREAKALLDISS